jgi:hypothetical protein
MAFWTQFVMSCPLRVIGSTEFCRQIARANALRPTPARALLDATISYVARSQVLAV